MVLTRVQAKSQAQDGSEGENLESASTSMVVHVKRTRGVNKRKEAAARNAEAPPFIFPHCTHSPPAEYALAIPEALSSENTNIFEPDSSYELIASRLLRLANFLPYVALFPYPIIDVKNPSRRTRRDRGRHKKTGDDRFAFTASSMFTWEKGERKVRMGIYVGTQPRDQVGHTWAVAVVDGRVGKLVVIYDPDAQLTFDGCGEELYHTDMHSSQLKLIKLMGSTKKVKTGKIRIKRIMWGGRAFHSNENRNRCLENTLKWMESCRDKKVLTIKNLQDNGFVRVDYNLNPTGRKRKEQNTTHTDTVNVIQDEEAVVGAEVVEHAEDAEEKDSEVSSDTTQEDLNDQDYMESSSDEDDYDFDSD